MSSFGERSERWNRDQVQSETSLDKEASWKDLGTSMNAISFGFVATAILVFMFLIMAIFERLIRQRQRLNQPQNGSQVLLGENQQEQSHHQLQAVEKLANSNPVNNCARDRESLGSNVLHCLNVVKNVRIQQHRRPGVMLKTQKFSYYGQMQQVLAAPPDLSVLMPGQRYPTFIAQPAPLFPFPREAICWPSHHQQALDCP